MDENVQTFLLSLLQHPTPTPTITTTTPTATPHTTRTQTHIHTHSRPKTYIHARTPVWRTPPFLRFGTKNHPFLKRNAILFSLYKIKYLFIYYPPIVWNQPNSASVILCLNGDNHCKQNRATPIVKHIDNMFIHTNVFSMWSKLGLARYRLKKWHRLISRICAWNVEMSLFFHDLANSRLPL